MQALYKYVVPKPREKCSKTEQLTVSFAAGYIAGVFCAVVSHPAGKSCSGLTAFALQHPFFHLVLQWWPWWQSSDCIKLHKQFAGCWVF